MCESMKFPPQYIDNIPPIECNIYVAYKTAEVERQKQNSKENTDPSVGSMPTPGSY